MSYSDLQLLRMAVAHRIVDLRAQIADGFEPSADLKAHEEMLQKLCDCAHEKIELRYDRHLVRKN